MDRAEFERLADRALDRVARWLEGFDPDEVDFSTTDGVVSLEFADGTRFVLNRQAGSHQMWLAAGARAWHYGWDATAGVWRDDRDGHDLFANLGRVVSRKLGREVEVG
ncbi:MAG: iron donor protein CyaY [Planctomycetota bacterium]